MDMERLGDYGIRNRTILVLDRIIYRLDSLTALLNDRLERRGRK